MNLPPLGITFRVHWIRILSPDTIEVSLPSQRPLSIRFVGCVGPQRETPEGRAAIHFLEAYLESVAERPVTLFIPLAPGNEVYVLNELQEDLTQGWIRGRIWAGTQDLSDLLLAHHHAEPVT